MQFQLNSIFSLEEIIKFMTPYMIEFIVILDIIRLRGPSCDRWVVKDKKSLNVQHGIFYFIIIKDNCQVT
jgi:hypothetical protein